MIQDEILEMRSKEIQQNLHETVEYVMGESDKGEYQDAVTTFFIRTIAELELRIVDLELDRDLKQ